VIVEVPVFVSVGQKPNTGLVIPLIGKHDGNPIILKYLRDDFALDKALRAVTRGTAW
jgi:hypothetical protein